MRAVLDPWGGGFVLRLTATGTVWLEHQGQKVGRGRRRGHTRRRALGRLWGLQSQPRQYGLAQARARTAKGRGAYGHVVSTRPLSALPLAQKYARRFSGAAGFRDTKPLGGVAAARIAEGPGWARLFARVAAAVCVLTQLGTHLGGRPQRPVWLRQVRSRRRGRTELRLVSIVCPQLDQVAGLWDLLTLHATLNLEAA